MNNIRLAKILTVENLFTIGTGLVVIVLAYAGIMSKLEAKEVRDAAQDKKTNEIMEIIKEIQKNKNYEAREMATIQTSQKHIREDIKEIKELIRGLKPNH